MKKLLLLNISIFLFYCASGQIMFTPGAYNIKDTHKYIQGQKSQVYENDHITWFSLTQDNQRSKKSVFVQWNSMAPVFVMGIYIYDISTNKIICTGEKSTISLSMANSLFLGNVPEIEKYIIKDVRWNFDTHTVIIYLKKLKIKKV